MSYIEERKTICDQCPSSAAWFCTECGCMIPVKIRIKDTECPKGLWNTQKIDNYTMEINNERR